MSDRRSLPWRATAALIRPNARHYGALIAVVAITNALLLTGPLILRSLIDRAADGEGASGLSVLAAAYLVLAVVSQAAGLLVAYLSTAVAWRSANDLRHELAEHVLGLDHEFHRSHSPGELIQWVDGDVTRVSDFLAIVFVRAASTLVVIGGVLVVVTVIDWRIGLAMAVYVAATATVIYRQRNSSVEESANEMSASAQLYGGIEERLTASEDLRANGAGEWAVGRFVGDAANYLRSQLARERSMLSMYRRLQVSVTLGAAAAIVGGALGVQAGVLTIGTAFLLFQYSQQIRRPLDDFINDFEVIQKANGAMLRVIRLLAVETTIVDADDDGSARSPGPGPLAVDFDDVSFHYGDGELVLDGIDLHIEPGRSVGVVGHSGSGKTTLSRLLVRLIEPTGGRVRLGGVPVGEIGKAELRRRVAVVPQNVELFKGTIADNVTFFDPDVDPAAIDEALTRVGLGAFTGPGRHHELGPGGSGLSAGEGQLLALARVWLRNPDLVVLDEATARIDPATEERLEAAINDLFENRSVFVIAHRLSTLRQVDEILVVEAGRVAEHGARAELEDTEGSRYRELLTVARGTSALVGGDGPGGLLS